MTSQLAYIGALMLVFGLGSFYATEHFAAFNIVNVIGGGTALVAAAIGGLRRLRFGGGPHARRVVTRGVLTIVVVVVLGTAMERAAHFANIQYDWTFERYFELSDATRKACADLGSGLRATLYHDPADPRTRQTRLLLRTLASDCEMEVRSENLDHDSIDVDRFEIGSSNTVVIEHGVRFETVSRPTEGAIYEALYRLRSMEGGTIVLLRGEGEGNPDSSGDLGFSGLATALTNEGYRLRSIATPVMSEIPEDTTLVLSLAPRRRIRNEPLEALGRYLDRGGRLVALLEPGVESGIEELLGQYGLWSPNSLIIDPTSGDIDQKVVGLNPVAYNYTTHPVTQGLNSNRMTFFSGARSFVMRKTRPSDRLTSVVLASPKSWISDDLALLRLHSG
ncbi:MAG: Gldg family protein, partial [Myxococcota bacterium]